MRHRYVASAIAVGGAAAYILAVRSWQLRWGATGEERAATLAGDDLIANPDLTATRAITVGTSAEQVWPWIAQLGQGRGGFYSYDGLENLVGADIHNADQVVAEWQDIAVGDEVRLAPEVGLTVASLEPGGSLVLRGAPVIGGMAAPYDFTWAFVVHELGDGASRLIVRERYGYLRPWAPLLVEPVEAISFVMSRRMLLGIKGRAERSTA
jgi:hypothetical protein